MYLFNLDVGVSFLSYFLLNLTPSAGASSLTTKKPDINPEPQTPFLHDTEFHLFRNPYSPTPTAKGDLLTVVDTVSWIPESESSCCIVTTEPDAKCSPVRLTGDKIYTGVKLTRISVLLIGE